MESDGDVSHGYLNPVTRQPTRFEKLTLNYVSGLERTVTRSIIVFLIIILVSIFPFQESIQTFLLIWFPVFMIVDCAVCLFRSK